MTNPRHRPHDEPHATADQGSTLVLEPAPTHRGQDGAVAVVVAICLLLLFAAGAVAVDLGSAWETKRGLVVDTDAAALAGAKALESADCAAAKDAAQDVLDANLGPADPPLPLEDDVSFLCGPDDGLPEGTVQVDATRLSQQTFSSAIQQEAIDVYASSTATTSVGIDVGGVRPFAVCSDDPLVDHFLSDEQWPIENDPLLDRDILLDETWKSTGSCGGASGNRGWFCFDENCGTSVMKDLLEVGYYGLDLGDATDSPDCNTTTPDDESCITKPGGTGNSLTNKDDEGLPSIVCADRDGPDCQVFPILVLDSWSKKGGRTEAQPYGVLYVRLTGWCINKKSGGASPGTCSNNDMGLRLDVLGLQTEGVPDGTQLGGPTRTWLCDVDHHTGPSMCEAGE